MLCSTPSSNILKSSRRSVESELPLRSVAFTLRLIRRASNRITPSSDRAFAAARSSVAPESEGSADPVLSVGLDLGSDSGFMVLVSRRLSSEESRLPDEELPDQPVDPVDPVKTLLEGSKTEGEPLKLPAREKPRSSGLSINFAIAIGSTLA